MNPIETQTTLPEPLFRVIMDLIRRDDVRSVSLPFDDFALWRELVAEQRRRSEATGHPLQRAFGLFGPEAGLAHLQIEEWGGEVGIPYEGASGADLFILPTWHRFFAEKIRNGGKLRWAVHKPCNRIIVQGDHGEVACATRTDIGAGWWLYDWTAPHEDCNPLFDPEFERIAGENSH
ncbi:MAG: hypothetical protein NTY05_04525 [Rhodocyclales bacterium]|nr:hypothetical protein [Rhodocyclales bacterium]